MANRFYVSGRERPAKVSDLFAAIASRYDVVNDLQSLGLHRRWKRRLVGLADAPPGARVLDVCCGTGDIALAFARNGAEVVGLDFSAPMLAVAEQRAKAERARAKTAGRTFSMEFLRADAQQIPFGDESFAVVTAGYGLRNLADWETGLREMQRVTQPGGRLLLLDFGKPENRLWRHLYFAYLRLFVPMLGRLFCGDAAPYAYILESLHHFPAQQGVAAKMRELGLVRVRVHNLLGGVMSISYAEKA